MAEVILKWKIESKNFDELKSTLPSESQKIIGVDHCKLCVLLAGKFNCIHRNVCRAISHNEVFINVKIEDITETNK